VLTGDYEGTITSDSYQPDISFAKSHEKVQLQLCLAHLKRDFKNCADFIANKEVCEFGQETLKLLDEIFQFHDQYKAAMVEGSDKADVYLNALKMSKKS
jgi:hypothetical protein